MFKHILPFLLIGVALVPKIFAQTSHSKMHKVFVYGTLKTGEPNHYWLTSKSNGDSKFIGKACTKEKFPLIIGTDYNIPFLLFSPGVGNVIEGEIYEVNEKMLTNLDILEDHPNYYIREVHTVSLIDEKGMKTDVDCWIYFIKTFNNKLLDQRMFGSYSSTGDHNLPYAERSLRNLEYFKKWKKDNLFID